MSLRYEESEKARLALELETIREGSGRVPGSPAMAAALGSGGGGGGGGGGTGGVYEEEASSSPRPSLPAPASPSSPSPRLPQPPAEAVADAGMATLLHEAAADRLRCAMLTRELAATEADLMECSAAVCIH